jgi:hypothetical protein
VARTTPPVSAPAACSHDSSGAEAVSSTEDAGGVLPPAAAAAAHIVRGMQRRAATALAPTRHAAATAPPSGAVLHAPAAGSALAPLLLWRCVSARRPTRLATRCIAAPPAHARTRSRRHAATLPAADGPHGARSAM